MEDDFKKMLELVIWAPSGENCQPWKFKIKNQQIEIFNIPERDQSIHNFQQRGSLIAHGALLENLQIAAAHFGYTIEQNLFPESSDPALIARLTLQKSALAEDELYPFITQRCTNRKPYTATPIPFSTRTKILSVPSRFKTGEVKLVEDEKTKKKLAEALSLSELLLFQNKFLHQFFFSHLNWSETQDQQKGTGLYIKTLELLPPQEKGLKIFSRWNVLKLFNLFGVAKKIAKENADRYNSSAAIGIIHLPGDSKLDFILTGRIFQRLWLTATKENLSLQPLTGILFFRQRLAKEDTKIFSDREKKAIETAYQNIRTAFETKNGEITMLFRLGYADPPTARSGRLEPLIITN